mgnify:CR=1 FL=1
MRSSLDADGTHAPDGTHSLTDYVPFLKALANPTRAQIIEFLLERERCVCEMTGPLDISQPLVSHHLALLRGADLVRMRSEGTRVYYSIAWERFDGDLQGFLASVAALRARPHQPDEAQRACADAARRPTGLGHREPLSGLAEQGKA